MSGLFYLLVLSEVFVDVFLYKYHYNKFEIQRSTAPNVLYEEW